MPRLWGTRAQARPGQRAAPRLQPWCPGGWGRWARVPEFSGGAGLPSRLSRRRWDKNQVNFLKASAKQNLSAEWTVQVAGASAAWPAPRLVSQPRSLGWGPVFLGPLSRESPSLWHMWL